MVVDERHAKKEPTSPSGQAGMSDDRAAGSAAADADDELNGLFTRAIALGLLTQTAADALTDSIATGTTTEQVLVRAWSATVGASEAGGGASPAAPPAAASHAAAPPAAAPAAAPEVAATSREALLAAATVAAASPIELTESPESELDYDEARSDRLAAEFLVRFTGFARENPGAGAASAAVRLIQAMAMMFVEEGEEGDDGYGSYDDGSYDDGEGYGSFDEGDWRP